MVTKEKEYYLDVDRFIIAHNDLYPSKPKMTRIKVAEILGVGVQVLSDWKSNKQRTPKWFKRALIIIEFSELAKIPMKDLIRERKN
jgi:hypothetical protein